jgi:hypothetical protein
MNQVKSLSMPRRLNRCEWSDPLTWSSDPENTALVPIQYEAGLGPEQVLMLYTREKYSAC